MVQEIIKRTEKITACGIKVNFYSERNWDKVSKLNSKNRKRK